MKKLLSLAVVAMLAMVACEKTSQDDQSGNNPGGENTAVSGTMTITSESPIDFKFIGGAGEITFTLEGAKEGDKPAVECAQAWITDLAVAETITFNVERSTVQEERTAIILVTYGEQEEQVFVKQSAAYEPAMVEFEAKALNGEYQRVSKSGNGYNYFIILSEKGTTGWYDLYIDAYYRIDLYSEVAPADLTENSASVLPQGVYYFDDLSLEDNGTFAQNQSARLECFEDGSFKEDWFKDGVLIVTENKVELYVTTVSGVVHHVVYEGSLEIGWMEIPAPDHYTSLTADYTFEHKGFVSQIYYYADAENVGLGNWIISAANSYETMNGDYLKVDVYLESLEYNPELIYGEYEAVATSAELKAGNFLGGVFGSWLYGVEDGYLVNGTIAPLYSGKVKIEKSGTGALITVDCVDDLGYKVQGTFECPTVEFYDLTSQMQ
ncbi:MAG: BACON domain-containing protein [Alistipes sp.]|nr:BACON domain-containing protein [Alistipes sp.]